MSEYDLVCDSCEQPLTPTGAVVSWTTTADVEGSFALTHAGHVPAAATDRVGAREVAAPNGYLRFVSERVGHRNDDAPGLRAILWALAPFVMRPDTAVEMDDMRAASFGAVVGVKPGSRPPSIEAPVAPRDDAGK